MEQICAFSFTVHIAVNLNGNGTRIHFLLIYISLEDKRLQRDMVSVFKEQLKGEGSDLFPGGFEKMVSEQINTNSFAFSVFTWIYH